MWTFIFMLYLAVVTLVIVSLCRAAALSDRRAREEHERLMRERQKTRRLLHPSQAA